MPAKKAKATRVDTVVDAARAEAIKQAFTPMLELAKKLAPPHNFSSTQSPVAEASAKAEQARREADAEAIAAALARKVPVEAAPPAITPPSRAPKTGKGIAPATRAMFEAFLFYERHEGIKEPITSSKLVQEVALYADKAGLPGAYLLRPTNATMRDLAGLALATMRHPPPA